MFNEFLTATLQVVIALNVAGLIAHFCLGSLRRRPALPQVRLPRGPSLWTKLITPCRTAIHQVRVASAGPASLRRRPGPPDSLETALGRLRRVLDGYGDRLA